MSTKTKTKPKKTDAAKAGTQASSAPVDGKRQPPEISLSEADEGSYHIKIGDNGPDDLRAFKNSLGIQQRGMLPAFVNQICNATAERSGPVEANVEFVLAFVRSIKPQDELEILLATQMAVVHIAAMSQSCAMKRANDQASREYAERSANRLMRTFCAQAEALRKHRHGGEQKVTVEHVTVNDGGQAVVGAVHRGVGK